MSRMHREFGSGSYRYPGRVGCIFWDTSLDCIKEDISEIRRPGSLFLSGSFRVKKNGLLQILNTV
jgi:hypothetical protein